jgi:hypothetical protein
MKTRSGVVASLACLTVLFFAGTAAAQNLPGPTTIRSAMTNGKNLDVPGGQTGNNVLIQQWTPNGGVNQQFRFYYLYNGYWAIGTLCTENTPVPKYFDVPGGSMNAGCPIQQYQWNGGENQQWAIEVQSSRLTTAGTVYTVMIRNRKSGLYLDVPGLSTSDGTVIQQFYKNGGPNQQWVIWGR